MKKRLISVVLTLSLLCACLPQLSLSAGAETLSGSCGDNLTWSFDAETGRLTITGSGAMDRWTYPSERPWDSFCGSIESVSLPNGLTTVGDWAFYSCSSIKTVTIPGGVTNIGKSAFGVCSALTDITIPNSVTSIGDYVFLNCYSLKSITIPDSVTNIGMSAFYNCNLLKKVRILNENCTIINEGATLGSPANTTVYGFKNSTAQAYAKNYGYSFQEIQDNSGECGANLTWSFDDNTRKLTITGSGAMDSWDSASDRPWNTFRAKNQDVSLPYGITEIGNYAFSGCSGLKSFAIPGSVINIGDYAFNSCGLLADLTIPNSVKSIGDYGFCGCTSLKSVTIPDGVTSIGKYTFYGCRALIDITIPTNMKSIKEYAFYDCVSLKSIAIPTSMENIERYTFYNCVSLKSITIPNSMNTIGEQAFSNCNSLVSVIIPDSVTSIGLSTFYGCNSLSSVTILNRDCTINNSTTALGNPEKTTIHGYIDSTAQAYSAKYGYSFVSLDGYTVSYNANGGLGAPESQMKTAGQVLKLSSQKPTKTYTVTCNANGGSVSPTSKSLNCSFQSWNTSENGSGTSYAPGASYTKDENATLYAQWTNPSMGTLPTPTKDNSTFDGWYTATSGGTEVTGSTPVTQNTTIYAHWTENKPADAMGVCGDSLSWSYVKSTGRLTVTGSGAMTNWSSKESVPWYAFAGNVKTVSLSEGLTTIGASAFEDCCAMTNVSIPATVTRIGSKAFYGCEGLSAVTIPDNVTSIDKYAFQYCIGMRTAVVGKAVTRIEDGAFRNCDALTSITINNPSCDFSPSSTTLGNPGTTTIVAPAGSSAEQYAKQYGYTFQTLGSQFTDVSDTAFYAAPVAWAVLNNITTGTSKTTFGPNATCTRGQVVTFLWRAKGSPKPKSGNNPFTDVKSDAYYYEAVLWAVEKNVTAGLSATTFGPNKGCTRGQVVTFLWRAQGQPDVSSINPFTDVDSSAFYYKAVLWAVKNNVTSGVSASSFGPSRTCTRGQIVTFLYRAMTNYNGKETTILK